MVAHRGLFFEADCPSVAPIYYDYRWRCEGLCSEEQLALHLMHAGIALRPLPWNLTIRRIYHAAPGEDAGAYAQRMARVRRDEGEGPGLRKAGATPCSARGPPGDRPRTHAPLTS